MSRFEKGQTPWNKGLKDTITPERQEKMRLGRIGKPHLSARRRIVKICPVCSNKFETGGRAGKRDQIFCSRLCMYKAKYHKGARCNLLSKVRAAYIAGFVDGEGTVLIIHRKPSNSYSIGVRVAQSARARRVLDWISEATGIGASINKNRTRGKNHDMGLTWACSGEAAISLLVQLLPFLIVKQKHAELAIDFQNRLRQPELKADRTWQAEYKEKMSILNKRGR